MTLRPVFWIVCALGAGRLLPAPAADLPPVADLIQKLGDSRWEVRESSQKELIARGTEAVEPLLRASRSDDPEVAHRARLILGRVDPLQVRVRIRRIATDGKARVAEVLEGQASESGDESGEV